MSRQRNNSITEEEIRPEYLKTDQSALLAADIRRLLRHKAKFAKVTCPACDSKWSQNIFKKYGLQYVICGNCETVYMNPRPTPGMLEKYYVTSKNYEYWNKYIFPASEVARRIKIFRPRVERLIGLCKRYGISSGGLLEVGAGFGTFCEEARRAGFFRRIIAVEPAPELARTCRKKGIEVIEEYVENIDLSSLTEDIRVVVSFEVLEHLFYPKGFIRSCAALLPRCGLLILTCPNVKGFDVNVLGALSGVFDNEHLNYFHPKSISMLLRGVGFKVVDISTPGRLDAELVRKAALSGKINLSAQPLLKHLLLEQWDRYGDKFQDFLAENMHSSHMWVVGRKK